MRRPATVATSPRPGRLWNPSSGGAPGPPRGRGRRGPADARCRVCAAAARRSSVVSMRRGRHQLGHRRAALGQRSGLVEHDRVEALRALAAPRRRGSGCRRARPRRCRPSTRSASPDPSAQGQAITSTETAAISPAAEIAAQQPPAEQRQERADQHDRHEHRRDTIDQPLHRRLVRLRALHQRDDARQRRVLADRRRFDAQQAAPLIAPPVTGSPGRFVHRQALAGEQALVDLALAR